MTKWKVLFCASLLVGGYVLGTLQASKPDTKTKTDEVVKEKEKTDTTKHTETQTTTTTDCSTGKTTTVTKVVEDENTKTKDTKSTETHKDESVSHAKSKVNVSALVSYNIHDLTPTYGLSAQKEFIGPITIGAFGLTNGTIGLSVGVNF